MSSFTQIVKDKFLKAASDYSMLSNCKKIIVGFSGGADSICLLHLLNYFKNDYNYDVIAAHVNHGIRGEEALRDQNFAEAFCKNNNIKFELLNISCITEAKDANESVEEYGRKRRYGFFNSLCHDNFSKIATAHNCNDNVETILFNLIRGTALKGIGGIPPVRGNIIRPIIYCTREEIEGYCKENNLTFVTDSTNLCDDYTRNKIRHNILPVMAGINPNILSSVTNFSNCAKESYSFIKSEANKLLNSAKLKNNSYDLSVISSRDIAVIKEFINQSFYNYSNIRLSYNKIEMIFNLVKNGGRAEVYGDFYAEAVKGQLRYFKYKNFDYNKKPIIIVEKSENSYKFNDFYLNFNKITDYSKKVNKNVLDNLLDCDNIVGQLYLRSRLNGDEFTLPKRNVTKSLKKLFNEFNVPVELRNTLPILCDDKGIVWIYSIGVCERCRCKNKSNNIIYIKGEYNSGE